MADERDLLGGEAERRDRRIGEDLGQHGAAAQKGHTTPNKSDAGGKDAPNASAQSDEPAARPEMNRGDRQNYGRGG